MPLSRFFRPTRPYPIVIALDAIGLPERLRNLTFDLSAAEASATYADHVITMQDGRIA